MFIEKFTNEKWKPVWFKGISQDEKYEVSDYGRIRKWRSAKNEWKVMACSNQRADGLGYSYFRFKTLNKLETKAVHRLVAMAFVERQSSAHDFVVHKDYNKGNNVASNLAWVTREELSDHNRKNPNVKEGHQRTLGLVRRSKLTETDVIRLKMKMKRGKTKLYLIAREFGITQTQLCRIRRGENWGHIDVD